MIIPTRNRADTLDAALKSLMRQSLPVTDFEILVTDNGSTDCTPEVITAYAAKLPRLRPLHAIEPGLHAGRHAGMKAALGDVLVFADDDIEAFPSWLESIADAFVDPRVVMVGGNNIPKFMAEPPDWLRSLWRRDLSGVRAIPALSVIEFPMERGEISPLQIWGCNFSIRRSVLEDAGGFHPDSMPKELIKFRGDGESHVSRYVAGAGLKCAFHRGASVQHRVPVERMTYDYFRQRGFNQGISDSYTSLRGETRDLRRKLSNLPRRITRRIARDIWSTLAGAEANRALLELKRGHREGYAFHQKIYSEDPDVRTWVHKKDYL